MRNANGDFVCESCCPGGKRTKRKNRCSSAECKCSPPIVNVHHCQCPLTKTPCPLHGYPFVYSLKNKKTPPDQCLVISFHPTLKTDKLFEPVKTFLNQTCEPDTKINFQYYSPRLSETYCEDFKHCQVQTHLEDLKKLNSCFVEKTKSFFSDKTNKKKKLKEYFNSPCSSIVHKSRSCTAIREKIDCIFQEGTRDGYPDKSKLEKRVKDACCMKSEESSHFLYKRDFDTSDGEISNKEKVDSDLIAKINNNLLDHNLFEIRSRKGYNERVSGNMRPYFTYTSFVSPDPVRGKVQRSTQTEEVSDYGKTNEGPQSPDDHSDESKERKERHYKASPDENVSSKSSESVYFTPFILVPGGNDKEVEHQEVQTVNCTPEMSTQWVQTVEYFHETSFNKYQTSENSEILIAKTEFVKTTETQTPPKFMSEAYIYGETHMTHDEEGKEKPVKTNVAIQTPQQKDSALLFSDYKFFGNIRTSTEDVGVKEIMDEATAPVSIGTQTQEKFYTQTVIYYEPEMKFLRRHEKPENEKKSEATTLVSLGTQTGETTSVSTVVYYEPEMKFLRRDEKPENEKKSEATTLVSLGTQTGETTSVSTVVYYEPEMKFLRRDEKPENEKKSEATALVSVGTQTEETTSVSTVVYYEPEMKFLTREESSKNKEKGVEAEGLRSVGVQTEETADKKDEKSRHKGIAIQETRHLSSQSFPRTGRTSKSEDQEDGIEKFQSLGVQTQETPPVLYDEPKTKFLSSVRVTEERKLITKGVQVQTLPQPMTVIYFEPGTKPLRRKCENGKRGVIFNEENQIKEIETDTKDKSVGTEPNTLQEYEGEKYDLAFPSTSQNKEIQDNSDSDTSQSWFDGSDASNATYLLNSYISEESEKVVVKNWSKSRSDGEMLEKKKCDSLMKDDRGSPPCQCGCTNPNGLTFVEVHRSKKETYGSSNLQDRTKTQLSKSEGTKKNEGNNASFADLSDLIRIIDENFKKMFDRRIGSCECQQIKEAKPTADKEVLTDITVANDMNMITQMVARSMANAQIQASLPVLEEMPPAQPSNPDEEPSTSICKVCSKVVSIKTMSVGTNTPDGSYIEPKMKEAKIHEVDLGTHCEEFTIESNQKPSCSKPPSTSKGKFGGIKSIRMSTKTFVTKFEKPPESIQNRVPAPTRPRNVTCPQPSSDSISSLQRNLRRAQKECGVKPKTSRPTPSPRPRPAPKSGQAQLSQSKPQVVQRVIPDEYCGNIVATTTTRHVRESYRVRETCPFDTTSENVTFVCPLPRRSIPEERSTQPKKGPICKQNHMTYHVTLSPLWSKDIMKIFQRKLRKISKSESSVFVNYSNGKHKRNHDAGSDGAPIIKKIKSTECDTNQLEHSGFELGKSQTDILCEFLMKEGSEVVLEEKSSQLTKNSGFVWIPSFPTPQFFTIRKVSSSEETTKPKETVKEVSRTHSKVSSKKLEENNYNNLSKKDTRQRNLEYTDEKKLLRKLFRCSSCKSLTYLQLKNSEIMENPPNNSTNTKSSLEECFKNLVFTPHSNSIFGTDEQINSGQKLFETVPSTKTNNILMSDSEENQNFFYELYSKFLSEKSDSYFDTESNQVETCPNSEAPFSKSDKGFSITRSNSSLDVSNSNMATNSESFRAFQFCAKSNSAAPDSKKTILKNFPSKIFQSSRRKSK